MSKYNGDQLTKSSRFEDSVDFSFNQNPLIRIDLSKNFALVFKNIDMTLFIAEVFTRIKK